LAILGLGIGNALDSLHQSADEKGALFIRCSSPRSTRCYHATTSTYLLATRLASRERATKTPVHPNARRTRWTRDWQLAPEAVFAPPIGVLLGGGATADDELPVLCSLRAAGLKHLEPEGQPSPAPQDGPSNRKAHLLFVSGPTWQKAVRLTD
jgi:hypothetical protein